LNNLVLISVSFTINFLLNGLSYVLVVRSLSDYELSNYLRIMAIIPVLAILSNSYQQVVSHSHIDQEKIKKSKYMLLTFKKSLPFSLLVLFGLFAVNEQIKLTSNFGILLVCLYLPLTYAISSLLGILQREKENISWQISTTLESLLRLTFVLFFANYFANDLAMFSAILISVSIVILIQLFKIRKDKFVTHKDISNSSTLPTLKLFAFALLVQSDVILGAVYLEQDEALNYILISNLVKLIYGVLYIYSQMSFSGSQSRLENKFSGFSNPNKMIPSLGIFVLVIFYILNKNIDLIIEKVLNRSFDLNPTLLSILLIATFTFAFSVLNTLQSVKGKTLLMPITAVSFTLFAVSAKNFATNSIEYAQCYLAGAIVYGLLLAVAQIKNRPEKRM